MSLSLLQDYSSAEEEEEDNGAYVNSSDDDVDERRNGGVSRFKQQPLFDPNPSSTSSLPSALDAFSEVAGPPGFLNNCVAEPVVAARSGGNEGQPWRRGRRRNRDEMKALPAGAVVEAKAQLVAIRDRVSSDAEVNISQSSSIEPQGSSNSTGEVGKRVVTATNPNAEDAAELLRMCLQCGIPKTFTNARGMVCPVCGDRPPPETDNEPTKKKGSVIKDKEKSKRMKGQSSHATWKSETEMQLRQQFD